MPDVVISPNMSMPVPIVGLDPGPDWANNLNACLGILDQHNHNPGQGVQITPLGLNINIDLSMNNNNLTAINALRFQSHSVALPGVAPNLDAVYVVGNELYYNDGVGNVVPITKNGSVNAGAGSITGLPSGTASASYSSGNQTFVWQSATNTPANMDFGSAIIREVAANAKGITLSSPSGLSADYQLTFPAALPGSTVFLTLDAGGNIADTVAYPLQNSGLAANSVNTPQIVNQSVTQAKLAPRPANNPAAAGEIAVSTSTTVATASTVDINIGMTVTITTTGRPIMLSIQSDGTTSTSALTLQTSAAHAVLSGYFSFYNGATKLCENLLQLVNSNAPASQGLFVPPSSLSFLDFQPAGTYTYLVYLRVDFANVTVGVSQAVLVAYEI